MGLATVVLLCLAADGAPAEAPSPARLSGQGRVWLGPGFDSNAPRDYVSADRATLSDGNLSLVGEARGRLEAGERFTLLGAYQFGARGFFTLWTESTLVQEGQLSARLRLLDWLELSLEGRARDRRGAQRDYTDLQGGLKLQVTPGEAWTVALEVDAHRFVSWSTFEVSFWGPEATLGARYRIDRRHALSAFGLWSPRTFNAEARALDPDGQGTHGLGVPRRDQVLGAGVGYAFRGPFHLSASYAYLDGASSSYGQSLRRHRLGVVAGVALPWELTALAQATLQLAQYPDGVYLSPQLTVADDDENGSSVSVKLVRALSEHWELDLRYAFYFNELPTSHFVYRRHVASVGVAFTF